MPVDGSSGTRIALIGFGEAAGAFLAGWGLGGSGRVRAFDLKSRDPAASGGMAARYALAGVEGIATPPRPSRARSSRSAS
jgi:hypothetical protein